MKSRIFMRIACVLLLAAGVVSAAGQGGVIAIRNARVVPVSSPVIEKGTVVIRDGLITDVGANVTVPAGAWVIDGEGLTLYPGLIDAVSSWGIPEAASAAPATGGRGGGQPPAPAPATPAPATPAVQVQTTRSSGPEDRPATQSWLRAADLVRPTDRRLDAARTAGYTTAVTFPKQGIVAGEGAVVNLGGERAGQMVIVPSVGLYLTTQTAGFSSFPGSLFGVMSYLRQLWIDADYYKQAQLRYAKNPVGQRRPEYDRALEGVLDAPRILLPAETAVQIDRMTRFAAEFKTPVVLYGIHDGYRAADLLKKSGFPVVVNLHWPVKARDSDPDGEDSLRTLELRANAPSTPAALVKAGVKFAFSADGLESPRDALRAVKKAVDAGLSREDAIRALTLSAAEIYGVADRLGSIDRGKIANLVLVKGDLFDDHAQVRMIFVDGQKYDPAPEPPAGFPGAGGRPGGPTSPIEEQEER